MRARFFELLFAAMVCAIASLPAVGSGNEPYLYILGVTQDAGYPQTGCYAVALHAGLAGRQSQTQRGIARPD